MSSPTNDSPAERWIDLTDDDLTVELVEEVLGPITDDLWVAAACVDRVLDNVTLERSLVKTGLSRTEAAVKEVQRTAAISSSIERDAADEQNDDEDLPSKLEFDDGALELVALRRVLLRRLHLLETYEAMAAASGWALSPLGDIEPTPSPVDQDDVPDLDPWADETSAPSTPQTSTFPNTSPPTILLSDFILDPLFDTALLLASTLALPALNVLYSRHPFSLFPQRLDILQNIPLHASPSEISSILPAFDFGANREKSPVADSTSQTSPDWAESLEAGKLLQEASLEISLPDSFKIHEPSAVPEEILLSAEQLSAWYTSRVTDIDGKLGLVDVALGFVQHGASQGIPGLDELGEELSLLSRLVYDTGTDQQAEGNFNWTLSRWHGMDTRTAVQAYLSRSTEATIADDIRRLVLPYLYVLEARQERTGNPDSSIPTRHLYDYILSAPIPIIAAIFEASKPTLPASQRLIKQNEDMARLALACLYGSDALNEWSTMSSIFECLPQWASTSLDENESDAADTTLRSMAEFVAPSTTRPKASPTELLVFFNPLPSSSLSRALDILDVHLESGEILAKWDVPAPLRWFLRSAGDAAQQRAWATRMARRTSTGESIEDDEEWVELMTDMVRLVGGQDGLMRGAFGLLTEDEVRRIFFEGLLSLGKFQLASRLLRPKHGRRPLPNDVVEQICLTMSHEFYDNASSGNYHKGEMKLAFDCLSVAPSSPLIIAEKEFIEATSKICSYGVQSRPGVPLAPIEIRLVKDRLGLVARVLSSNDDVYKHSEVVLDIVHKLGFRDDLAAEVKTYAMLADAATQAEDFSRAAETSERMVKTVKTLQATVLRPSSPSDTTPPDPSKVAAAHEAVEVCWHTCFQLGRQPEFPDIEKKLTLLAWAMQLCPSENVPDVLNVWRRVEGESLESHEPRTRKRGERRSRTAGQSGSQASGFSGRLPSLSAHLLSMPNTPSLPLTSDAAAAMATRTLNRMAGVAAQLPFSLRGRQRDDSPSGRSTASGMSGVDSDVSHQARAVFARGVGWLIGADDE